VKAVKIKSICFAVYGILAILLCGINLGFSQNPPELFTTYENKEIEISFQYPKSWIEAPREVREEFSLAKEMSGKNLTENEKVMVETLPTVVFFLPDPIAPTALELVNYNFPSHITVEEITTFENKVANSSGYTINIIESTNTSVSNKQIIKEMFTLSGEKAGPAAGEYTSVSLLNGTNVINITIGPYDITRSWMVDMILQSIKIDNNTTLMENDNRSARI